MKIPGRKRDAIADLVNQMRRTSRELEGLAGKLEATAGHLRQSAGQLDEAAEIMDRARSEIMSEV